jgi:hypothetical protein
MASDLMRLAGGSDGLGNGACTTELGLAEVAADLAAAGPCAVVVGLLAAATATAGLAVAGANLVAATTTARAAAFVGAGLEVTGCCFGVALTGACSTACRRARFSRIMSWKLLTLTSGPSAGAAELTGSGVGKAPWLSLAVGRTRWGATTRARAMTGTEGLSAGFPVEATDNMFDGG